MGKGNKQDNKNGPHSMAIYLYDKLTSLGSTIHFPLVKYTTYFTIYILIKMIKNFLNYYEESLFKNKKLV